MAENNENIDPVFVPDVLPCPPVLTRRGWFYFDEWGREVRVKPQPERPPEAFVPVRKLCTYFKLRKKFLYLPERPMKTERALKMAMKKQKKHREIFFLPVKEKQQALMKEHTDKLWAKKSKKHKEQAAATGEAFASEFGGFLTAREVLEQQQPPQPPPEEEEETKKEKAVCTCKSVTLTCLTCGFEPCLCMYGHEGLTNEEERMCDKCGGLLSCQACKCQPCFCGDDYDPTNVVPSSKRGEEQELEAARKVEVNLLEAAEKQLFDGSESENEWEDDLVHLD